MAKEAATPLSVMLGTGEALEIAGKKYRVLPLKLREVQEFLDDNLSVGPQLVNLLTEEHRAKVSKWLGHVVDESGKPMDLERAQAEDWTIADLRLALQKLMDLSG